MPVTVSICIPTYNGERYLATCLDSALAQTFTDFEVVVVDDGSTDATLAVVRRYAEADARIRVSRNPRNLGLVGNWNRCVELARGAWIKFLFQDDLLEPTCLEVMLRASRTDVDLVVTRRGLIVEAGTPTAVEDGYRSYLARHDLALHWPGHEYVTPEQFAEILLRTPAGNCIGEPTATLVRRSAFERYGGFNGDLVILCDWEHSARVAANRGLCYVDTTLAHFRIHADAASSKAHTEKTYRLAFIDPLIIMHEITYSRHYATVRGVARRLRPPLDLRARLAEAVHTARAEASGAPSSALRSEWWRAVRRYPRLAWLQLGHVLR